MYLIVTDLIVDLIVELIVLPPAHRALFQTFKCRKLGR